MTSTEKVTTTEGDIDPDLLGLTLTHEHIFINLLREYRASGLLNDPQLMRKELEEFQRVGGKTIVDVTTAELTVGASQDPLGLYGGSRTPGTPENRTRTADNVVTISRIAREAGIRLVLGTGHYRDPYLNDSAREPLHVAAMAEAMIRDITDGFPGTDIRAGIIGEIGADKWYVSSAEERVFHAAGIAQRETGKTVTTHAARWPVGVAQLDILTAAGADPTRVIIGHCDSVAIPDYHEDIARHGAYVQFDTIRGLSEYDTDARVAYVVRAKERGYLDKILLSHDVCTRTHLKACGGPGFVYVPTVFVEKLRAAGISDAEVSILLKDNPRRALSGTNA